MGHIDLEELRSKFTDVLLDLDQGEAVIGAEVLLRRLIAHHGVVLTQENFPMFRAAFEMGRSFEGGRSDMRESALSEGKGEEDEIAIRLALLIGEAAILKAIDNLEKAAASSV